VNREPRIGAYIAGRGKALARHRRLDRAYFDILKAGPKRVWVSPSTDKPQLS
jgi:hypothetical protein